MLPTLPLSHEISDARPPGLPEARVLAQLVGIGEGKSANAQLRGDVTLRYVTQYNILQHHTMVQ